MTWSKTRIRTTLRLMVPVLVLLGTILVFVEPAAAHAALRSSSSPEQGAILDEAPRDVVLRFTEAPDLSLSQFQVVDGSGGSVTAGPARTGAKSARSSCRSARSGRLVQDLLRGRVRRRRSLVDERDLLRRRGRTRRDAGGRAGVLSDPCSVGRRGALGPVLGPCDPARHGNLVVRRLSWRDAPYRSDVRGRLVPGRDRAIVLPISAAIAADVTVADLLASSTGGPLMRQAIAVVVAGVAARVASRRRTSATMGIVGAAAAVALLFHTLGGHAAAAESGQAIAVAIQWLHVVAVGVWIGGLVWLVIGCRRADPDVQSAAIKRFSRLATVALAVVLVTGVLRSVDLLGGWGEYLHLLATGWGTALAWKLALFASSPRPPHGTTSFGCPGWIGPGTSGCCALWSWRS